MSQHFLLWLKFTDLDFCHSPKHPPYPTVKSCPWKSCSGRPLECLSCVFKLALFVFRLPMPDVSMVHSEWNKYIEKRWREPSEKEGSCFFWDDLNLVVLELTQWAAYWDLRSVMPTKELNSWVGNKHNHSYFKGNCDSNTGWRSCLISTTFSYFHHDTHGWLEFVSGWGTAEARPGINEWKPCILIF